MDQENKLFNVETKAGGYRSAAKLTVFDWLSDIPNSINLNEFVEVRFKNTRKDYFQNVNNLQIKVGDIVAVESHPGHDIGVVSLVGDLVLKQMNRHKITKNDGSFRKLFRVAKDVDIEKWRSAIELEHETMLKARAIAEELNLNMKIGDVEYQGDRSKAIFYYIADERVDFRALIRVYADTFRVRVEMKQIGARQEAGLIGGIGSCGRELCCSSWITNFISVSTTAARYQEISLNPQKLAGQCGKLKCCLNYELASYMDAHKSFPNTNITLFTEAGKYYYQKSDIFKGVMWYVHESKAPGSIISLKVETVRDVIDKNKHNVKVERLYSDEVEEAVVVETMEYSNVVGQDSLDRFDEPKSKDRKGNKRRNNNRRNNQGAKHNRGNGPKEGAKGSVKKGPVKDAPNKKSAAPDGKKPQNNRRKRVVKNRPQQSVSGVKDGEVKAKPPRKNIPKRKKQEKKEINNG